MHFWQISLIGLSIVCAVQMICILQASATNVNETYRYEKKPMKEICLLLIILAVQMICT